MTINEIKNKLKKYKIKMKQIALIELKLKNNRENTVLTKQAEFLRLELQEIDIALESLIEDEIYLVKEHYILGRQWIDIEITYNEHFKFKTAMYADSLRKRARKALNKLIIFYETIENIDHEHIESCENF